MFLKIVLMLLKSTSFMPCLCVVNTTWFNYVDCIKIPNTTNWGHQTKACHSYGNGITT